MHRTRGCRQLQRKDFTFFVAVSSYLYIFCSLLKVHKVMSDKIRICYKQPTGCHMLSWVSRVWLCRLPCTGQIRSKPSITGTWLGHPVLRPMGLPICFLLPLPNIAFSETEQNETNLAFAWYFWKTLYIVGSLQNKGDFFVLINQS